ncbi:hypothetical protein [Paenibacillus sp. Soil724D2]|uniref:hypothetical protein n=1 Tax=Paenibacillus sp. (strain Soil724D2) TaxID=1736392 RepID=UPI0012E3EC2C|nr:hypothetical protein [Paenibacillus sp. Soil724D2]
MGYLKRKELREKMMPVIVKSLEDEGYKLLSKTYTNNSTHMVSECPRGHEYTFTWNGWNGGKRCRHCWIEDSRLTQEQVALRLSEDGCELLGEYTGCEKPFKYKCNCGNVSSIRLHDWQKGVRCSRCAGHKARLTMRENRKKEIMEFFSRVE